MKIQLASDRHLELVKGLLPSEALVSSTPDADFLALT